MTRLITCYATFLGFILAGTAFASDAATSATAGNVNGQPGTAAATATYQGDRGFANTSSQSGRVDIARGVAVGIDQNGLSLSISNAIATRNGTAVATNFNLDIERDGEVSWSRGSTVANGPIERSATVSGSAGNGSAVSMAGGRTDDYGRVRVSTESHNRPALLPVREHAKRVIVLRRER